MAGDADTVLSRAMRRPVVLAIVLLELVTTAATLGWAVAHWRQTGWAGFAWTAYTGRDSPLSIPWLAGGVLSEGAVMVVDPWSPAAEAGVRQDEVVLQVAGAAASELAALRLATADLRPGDAMAVVVRGPDGERELEIVLSSPLGSRQIVAGMVVSTVVALAYLVIALIVAWARPGSPPTTVFFLLSACGAALFVLWAAAEPVLPDLSGARPLGADLGAFLWMAVVVGLSMVMVNLLLHFALVFPQQRPVLTRWPTIVTWIHTAPFLPVVAIAAALLGAASERVAGLSWVLSAAAILGLGWSTVAVVRSARREGFRRALISRPWVVQGGLLALCLATAPLTVQASSSAAFFAGVLVVLGIAAHVALVSVVWSLATCIALARSYRDAGPEARRQLRWPLWGLAAPLLLSLAIMVLGFLVGLTDQTFGAEPMLVQFALGTLSKLSYVLIPAAFAFGILRYRLMDVDQVIRRTLVYGGLTAFVALAYLGLVGLLGVTLVEALGLEGQTTVVLATVAVAAACVPVRRWLQSLVDRRMARRRLDREALLARADAAVLDAGDLPELGRSLADDLHDTLTPSHVAVWLVAPGGRRLTPLATVGLGDEVRRRAELPTSDRRLQQPGAFRVVGSLGSTEAAVAAPALLGERVIGMVSAGERRIGDPLDDDDATLIAAVANRLALGAGRLLPRGAELESAEARRIQESMLPATLPEVPGITAAARWRPAREVSGDAYDLVVLPDGQLGVAIADVAGKGTGAALLMANLQAAVRSTAAAGAAPAELARRVRETVVGNLRGGRFVTFCWLVVDPDSGRVTWVNLGHEPPLLLRSDGRLQELAPTGPAIARLLRTLPIEADVVTIRPGDRLLLFTDGVTESLDPSGALFGRDRLAEVVAAAPRGVDPLVEAVAAAVAAHSAGALADDLTVVAVERTPTAAEVLSW